MSLKFKKSIKILPGIKLNISKNGLSSVTIGKQGTSVNISRKGSKATLGIPGTGISYSKKIPSLDLPQKSPTIRPSTASDSNHSVSSAKMIILILTVIFAFLLGAIFF